MIKGFRYSSILHNFTCRCMMYDFYDQPHALQLTTNMNSTTTFQAVHDVGERLGKCPSQKKCVCVFSPFFGGHPGKISPFLFFFGTWLIRHKAKLWGFRKCMIAMFWGLVLLIFLLYVFALIFAQGVASHIASKEPIGVRKMMKTILYNGL